MSKCEEILARMTLYLDDELEASDWGDIKVHLAGCDSCRASFDSERRLLETVRGLRPLHVAPLELRAGVEKLLNNIPPARAAPPELRERIRQTLGHFSSRSSGLLHARQVVALAAMLSFAIWLGCGW